MEKNHSRENCMHVRVQKRRYVGSVENYVYCPDCLKCGGGQEGDRKNSTLADDARFADSLAPEELDEIEREAARRQHRNRE